MMKKYLKQYLAPTILTLAIFGCPLWDKFSPMQGSGQAIIRDYGGQYAWCVAMNYVTSSKETSSSRLYILFPEVFTTGDIVSVESVNNNIPSTAVNHYAVLFILFVYGGIIYGMFIKPLINQKNQGANI
jgi:hypothetical protein